MRNGISVVIPVLSVALFFLSSRQAVAQGADSFKEVQGLLQPGETVIVTSDDGSKVKGRMIDISADRIVFRLKDGERSIPASGITRVQHYRNGVLLGAIIGGAAGIPFAIAVSEYANNEGAGAAVAFVPILLGTGIGVGIDALLKRPRTVYRRRAPVRVTASPIVDRSRRGMMLAVNF